MKKKSMTMPKSSEFEYESDPRKFKKEWLKGMFLGDKEAYKEYLSFWDKAFERGATYVATVALLDFNKYWTKDSNGYWVRRLEVKE